MYIFPWFSKSWTSRRILTVETLIDVTMTLGWLGVLINFATTVGGQCSSYSTQLKGCVQFNWLCVWIFFLFCAWGSGIYFDITAWRRGLNGSSEIDTEIMLDIRKATRGNRFK
jgi:hypothetical protein